MTQAQFESVFEAVILADTLLGDIEALEASGIESGFKKGYSKRMRRIVDAAIQTVIEESEK